MSNFALVRVPKTGSMSMVAALGSAVFTDANPCMRQDHYEIREFLEHGHSHDFLTTVRDPLQVYVSCWYFMRNRMHIADLNPEFRVQGVRGTLSQHRDFVRDLPLEEYLLAAPVNDFYGRFFAGAEIEDFAFVGNLSDMPASLALLEAVTGWPTNSQTWVNRNPKRPKTLQPYYVSPDVTAQFKVRNELEYELYARGVAHFETLKKKYL